MANDYRGLLSGYNWGGIEVYGAPTIVTFSFPTSAPAYVVAIDDPNLTPTALASFQAFSPAEATMARDALAEWDAASGLTFIEVAAGQGDINFGKLDFSGTGYDGAGGIGYRPFGAWQFASYPYFTSDLDSSGDIFMNSGVPVVYGTLLHEIGHAIGLKHPTEAWTDYAADPDVVHAVWDVDDPALTIMSQATGGGTGHLTAIDVDAARYIYGVTDLSYTWNAATQTLRQIGNASAQALRGSSVIDLLYGRGGDDKLFGLNGDDTLQGEDGNDLLDGGPGADKMKGGGGDDQYFVDSAGDRVYESTAGGYDSVIATIGWTMSVEVEQLQFWGSAKLTGRGNALGNVMFADDAGDIFYGGDGDDYMVGGAGVDTLRGDAGADTIYGGGGLDRITGGAGGDYMQGDAGEDRFLFLSMGDFGGAGTPDIIADLHRAERDKIDLRTIDPDAALAGDQAFTFIGTAAFSGTGYQVRYTVSGGDLIVELNINADTVADASFVVRGTPNLVAGDFLL